MINTENKPLNLKYVADVIGDNWRQWKPGDVVTINAQTGTGKTTFITGSETLAGLIDFMSNEEKLLYICNRIALKRQIKLDLLKKYQLAIPCRVDRKGVPIKNKEGKFLVDFKKIDDIPQIRNIIITSYHALAEIEKEKKFSEKTTVRILLDDFKYIVCDEAHFLLADSAFMTKSNLVFNKILRGRYPHSVLIYISATINEILPPIKKAFIDNQNFTDEKLSLHEFTTGVDYSYLDVKYFREYKDIITLIHNDKSNEKWIIFVTSIASGDRIQKKLNEYGIESVFVKSGSKDKEIESIVNTNRFNCKVLISTKFLDNGINIKDMQVTNIVIAAYDKTTFIQEIGRVRVNIENPQNINLYIKTMNRNVFERMVNNFYLPKQNDLDLFRNDKQGFKNKYNMNLKDIDLDIFYLDENNDWVINLTGIARLRKDYLFALKMIAAFERKDKFAYIKEQLRWLELEHTFNAANLIEDVPDETKLESLKEYLERNIGRLYLKDEKDELIDAINLTDSRGRKQKSPSLLKEYLESNFDITLKYNCETSRMINGTRKKFKSCWKLVQMD